jgi:hypothetical protein
MLKIILVFILVLSMGISFVADAENNFTLNFESSFTRNLGYSTYELRGTDSGGKISSKLEFPLDSFFIGAQCILFPGDYLEREWDFQLGVYCNLNAPASKMLDHDWIEPVGFPKLKFSYTESNADMFMLIIDARVHYKIASLSWFDLYLCCGYSFQYITQRVNGYSGWQIDLNTGIIYDVEASGLAMLYDIYYHLPAVGLLVSMQPVPGLVLEGEVNALAAIVYDRDDHVLRNKLSTSFGIGIGINPNIRILYYIPCSHSFNIYLGLECRFSYIFIPAKQRQRWYADDPGTPTINETGTVYTDIIHDITSLSLSGGLKAGISYAF